MFPGRNVLSGSLNWGELEIGGGGVGLSPLAWVVWLMGLKCFACE